MGTANKNMVPALVLGCHKIGLGIIRALGEKGIPVVGVYYNKMDMGYVSRYVVADYHCPHPDYDELGFIAFLMELAKKWGTSVLVPSDDATLIPVSKHKRALSERYRVAAVDWEITEKFIAKKNTYAIAKEIGVPAPETLIPADLSEALDFVKKVGFPCLLKPSVGHTFYGMFKKKMLFLENSNQLEIAYNETETIDNEMMLQEFIPGDDMSGANYNSFFVDGGPRIEVTAAKVRLSPPRTGFPRVVVSRHIADLLAPGRKMLSAINYDGYSCMEFKKDARNGVYKLMEINGRLNLTTPLSVKAGINFPYLAYTYAITGKLPDEEYSYKEGIYWIDLLNDIKETIKSTVEERTDVAEYIKPYLQPHVFAVLSMYDPLPFIKRMKDIVISLPSYVKNIR